MKTDRAFLLEEKYNGIETPEYFSDCKKLDAGEPLAYVIGWIPFLGVKVLLDSHPLIPRPETEFWVEEAIQKLRVLSLKINTPRVLDLFSGSGCVGISILHHIQNSTVDFGDIETRHFKTIEKSLAANNLDTKRASCIETDVYSSITEKYDAILSNPPYLSKERLARLEPSVLIYEPEEALFASEGGYSLIGKTIAGLKEHLLPHGFCFIEHEPEHSEKIQADGLSLGFNVESKMDQFGLQRYSILTYT